MIDLRYREILEGERDKYRELINRGFSSEQSHREYRQSFVDLWSTINYIIECDDAEKEGLKDNVMEAIC